MITPQDVRDRLVRHQREAAVRADGRGQGEAEGALQAVRPQRQRVPLPCRGMLIVNLLIPDIVTIRHSIYILVNMQYPNLIM